MFAAIFGLILIVSAAIGYGVLTAVFPVSSPDRMPPRQTAVSSISPTVISDAHGVLGQDDTNTFVTVSPTPLPTEAVLLTTVVTASPMPTKRILTPTPTPSIGSTRSPSLTNSAPTVTPTRIPTSKPTVKLLPTLTPLPKPTNIPTPLPTFAPLPTISVKPLRDGLNADTIFTMVNDFRRDNGKPNLRKDETVCSIAQIRAPQVYDEIFVTDAMHAGLKAMQLPYRITENIIYYHTEQGAVDWWLDEPTHRHVILSDYVYSCVACHGYSCSQIFTSYIPK